MNVSKLIQELPTDRVIEAFDQHLERAIVDLSDEEANLQAVLDETVPEKFREAFDLYGALFQQCPWFYDLCMHISTKNTELGIAPEDMETFLTGVSVGAIVLKDSLEGEELERIPTRLA